MLITASPLIEYDEENDKIRAMPEFNKQNGNKASNVSFTFSIYEKKKIPKFSFTSTFKFIIY